MATVLGVSATQAEMRAEMCEGKRISFIARPTYRASAAPTTLKSRHDVWASKTAALASEASSWAASHNNWVSASCKRLLGSPS